MRSLTLKAALAAFLVSAPLGGIAFAAPMHEPHFRSSDHDDSDAPPPTTYVTGGQLSAVLNDLRDADARIQSDQHLKLITPAEARGLEAQGTTIRKAAVADSVRDGGLIPAGEYHQLMARISGLDDQVGHDAFRG
ncbi:hypothetical protein [Aminobacter niigataensis]|uniref:hypothetical protein n=1 Tax=Aminobacter niigataensis TaxID=83265 RepID=UPI0024C9146B|nr:hypothetical protein [Aminobacter niigataensis]CAI2932703.1 conserved exported protein of unknown function [Aminobacter niigataensis]